MKITKLGTLHCDALNTRVPAQAGTHGSIGADADGWTPAFAGARIN
jgi:hypothetical protein